MAIRHKIAALMVLSGLVLANPAPALARGTSVPHWMMVAVELTEYPVEIPNLDEMVFRTNEVRDESGDWTEFQFNSPRFSLPEGYFLVAHWSSDPLFDKHSLRTRKQLSSKELALLQDGALRLRIRSTRGGYFRFEFWSPRKVRLKESRVRPF